MHAYLTNGDWLQQPNADWEMHMNEQLAPREVEARQIVEEKAMIDHLVQVFHPDRGTDVAPYQSHSDPVDHQITKKGKSHN